MSAMYSEPSPCDQQHQSSPLYPHTSKKEGWTHAEVVREARLEGQDTLDVLDLLLAEADVQRLDVHLKMLDLAATDDGEDVCRLLHHVCDCNCRAASATLRCVSVESCFVTHQLECSSSQPASQPLREPCTPCAGLRSFPSRIRSHGLNTAKCVNDDGWNL